jgi:hypothetical protein
VGGVSRLPEDGLNVTKPLVGIAALALAGGIALPSVGASGNKYESVSSERVCNDDGDTVTLDGPLKLWPPNHKFVDEPVTAQPGDNSSGTSLTITPGLADVGGGDGGAQHDPDTNASEDGTIVATDSTDPNSENGSATAALALRAERSGKGDGRTYTINWSASFNNGARSCSSSTAEDDDPNNDPFVIFVPHDMRGGADWK